MSSFSAVKISNVSLSASEQDIKEFFSFSGEVVYVEIERGDDSSQAAYVIYKQPDGAETALLLAVKEKVLANIFIFIKKHNVIIIHPDQGAKIMDQVIEITAAPDYQPPANVSIPLGPNGEAVSGIESAARKAESVITTMLAKGYILGKDAVGKAKAFDEKHQLTSTASAKVSDLEKRIGLRDKISMGTAVVNEKVTEMDQKYQVSEKTKSAIASAEQKVSTAGAAIMKNKYVFTSAAWVSGAINKVSKAAADVGTRVKGKAAEQEASAANYVAVVTEEDSRISSELELEAAEMAEPEKEDGPGNGVEWKGGYLDVPVQEVGAGDSVESKTANNSATDEQHRAVGGLYKADVSEPSKGSSTEHQGKPESA